MGIKVSDKDFRCGDCIDTSNYERFTYADLDADKSCTYCGGSVVTTPAEAAEVDPVVVTLESGQTVAVRFADAYEIFALWYTFKMARRGGEQYRAAKIRKHLKAYAAPLGLTLADAQDVATHYSDSVYDPAKPWTAPF